MNRIIVALDFASSEDALKISGRLDPGLCRVKVGKELFTAAGPSIVEKLMRAGFEVFFDLKFHDIPNTVAQACKAASKLGVWMFNVHAQGGRAMLTAAREALEGANPRPKLVAVTLLTSVGQSDLAELGFTCEPRDLVLRLAALSHACGLDGVVCSAMEAAELRRRFGKEFCLVTPGIRPSGSSQDDQQRATTPRQAIDAGSDYLVIGRPITQAADPQKALEAINREIS